MDRKFVGVTARKKGVQMSISYKNTRIREYFAIEPNVQNMRAINRRREAALLAIELDKFDYYEHFPNGKNGHLFNQHAKKTMLFSEFANNWLKKHSKRVQFTTLKDYTSILNAHLLPVFGGYDIRFITSTQIKAWLESLTVSPKRINNILSVLRLVLEEAFEDEIIECNPTHRIKNFRLSTREPQPFASKEIDRILNFLDGEDKNLVQLAFYTGLRTSELVGLDWENVDFVNDRIYIRQAIILGRKKSTKTRAGTRTVYLNNHSRSALEDQRQISLFNFGLVFRDCRNPDQGLNDQKIRKRIWTPALNATGINYRPPYQTRHTYASMMLQLGKSPIWVANQLGHANAAITFSRYARWIPNKDEN